jgi:hypothetical protein
MVVQFSTPYTAPNTDPDAPHPLQCAEDLGLDPRRLSSREISAVCPDCGHGARKRTKRAFSISTKPGKFGVCHCLRCGFSGHIHGIWRKRFGVDAPAVRPTPIPHKPSSRKRTAPVSMPEVWDSLTNLRPRYRDNLVRWARRRGWPEEIAQLVADDPELAYATSSTGDQETDRICAAALNTRMQNDAGAWKAYPLPVLTAHRDPEGRVRSFNRRHNELPQAPPSKTAYASRELTLYSGIRIIGQLPVAVQTLCEGGTVYLVEGEPDFAVASALTRLDGSGYALGAPAHLWMPAVARELRKAAIARGKTFEGRVVVVPHVGDHKDVGLVSAREAAAELRRVVEVRIATVSMTKGDLADVLEKNGNIQDVREVLGTAEVYYEAPATLEMRRQELKHLVPSLLRTKGDHVLRGVTGVGKTRILLESLLDIAAELVNARIAYRRNGILPLDPFLKWATQQDKILLQYTVPTRGLRTELFAWINRIAAEKRLYNYAAITIREKKSRADGKDDPAFCRYPHETAAAAKTIAGGAMEVCQGCNFFNAKNPAMSGCGFWEQARKAAGEVILEITTHAGAQARVQLDDDGNELDADRQKPTIRVIDESPVDCWYEQLHVDLTQLAAGLQCGDLAADDADWRKLSDLISNGASSAAFNSAFQHNTFKCGDGQTTGRKYLKDAAADPARKMEILSLSPDWRFWRRFAQAQQNAWAGVYTNKQKLTVIDRRVDTDSEWATIYADATVTKPIADALMPGASWHALDIPLPPTVKVIRADWTAGKSNLMRKDNKQTSRLWNAGHLVYDSAQSLHMTHKPLVDDLREHAIGPVTYFGAPDATGSNRYEHCTRIIADAWYVPHAAISALAGKLAASDTQGRPAAYWKEAARDHLIDRRIHQAIGRIRPYDGRKVELIILSPQKDQQLAGLEPDATVSGNTLAWTHDHQLHGNVLAQTIRQKVRDELIVVPALAFPTNADSKGAGHATQANCRSIDTSCVDWVSAPLAAAVLAPEQIRRQLADHYAEDWRELALDTGLFYYGVPTSRGGQPVAVLTSEAVTADDVVPHMCKLGVAWFRWRGKRIILEEDTRLRDATAAAARTLCPGQLLTTAAIAATAELSERQVRRLIKALGVEVQDWLERHTPSPQPATDERSQVAPATPAGHVSPTWPTPTERSAETASDRPDPKNLPPPDD